MKIRCPFCNVIHGGEKDRVILKNDLGIAIRDGYPITKGHSLIIPNRHIGSFFETTSSERQALLVLVDDVKVILEKAYAPNSFNIGINDGPDAGQTVPHLHIHLIPRYKGDVPDPRGGIRWVVPEKADYWSKIK
ncbi:HIT family protein [Pseudomonadota bacterium]